MNSDEKPLLERPDDYSGGNAQSFGTHSADSSTTPKEASVLIVKDCDPWEVSPNEEILKELKVPYRVIESGKLVDEDLGSYSIVLAPSTQPQEYYNRLAKSKSQLETFVSRGGVFVSHTMHSGWPCNAGFDDKVTYLPGDVRTNFTGPRDQNYIVETEHPVVKGLSHDDLSRPEVSYGELTNVPESATVVLRSSSEEKTYIEYGYGDGRVLATGNPMEGAWTVEGHGPLKQLLRNELAYVTEQLVSNEVSASLTTLQFIPGEQENPSQGGHPLNSGLMQIIPEEDAPVWAPFSTLAEVGAEPVFDSWLGGDMTDELPLQLEKAREKKLDKYIDDTGLGESFNEYRFENSVDISFEIKDGGNIESNSIEIQFSETGPSGVDPHISRGDRKPSKTVLHDHDLNGIPWREWYDNNNVRRSNREPRYFDYNTEFEFDGVEGIRVVTVLGGWAGFMEDVAQRASHDPDGFLATIWDWNEDLRGWILRQLTAAAPEEVHYLLEVLTTVPRTFTFLDFIVLADGRRYAKIWDSSPYPSRYTYVDNQLRDQYDMQYEPKEQFNLWMTIFHARAITGVTPHSNKSIEQYMRFLRTQVKLTEIGKEDLPDDFKRDPWSVLFEERFEELQETFDLDVDELKPVNPRTLGFHANGDPIDNPEAPFPPVDELKFPADNVLSAK